MISSPLVIRGQVLLNLNRCGSMRHIEDAVTRAHYWMLSSRKRAVEVFVGSG